jgi:hypothetical protein
MNHPNRNWRARMRAGLAKWLESSEADVLINAPMREATPDTLAKRIKLAYEAGYRDGRLSK